MVALGMGNLNKGKAEKTALFTVEVLREMVLGFIPGGHLVEGFLNFNSGLKQSRIIDFAESLKKVLEENVGRELDSTDFENEDFVYVFETVINKVQNTKSKFKRDRFRCILAKQIVSPALSHEVESYIKLLDELGDVEIIMLNLVELRKPRILKGQFPVPLAKFNREKPIVEPGAQTKSFIRIGEEDVPVTDHQIDFLEQGLVNKGLLRLDVDLELYNDLIKAGKKEMAQVIAKEPSSYYLTEFGKSFLDYIKLDV
jgi:hypothetical protein